MRGSSTSFHFVIALSIASAWKPAVTTSTLVHRSQSPLPQGSSPPTKPHESSALRVHRGGAAGDTSGLATSAAKFAPLQMLAQGILLHFYPSLVLKHFGLAHPHDYEILSNIVKTAGFRMLCFGVFISGGFIFHKGMNLGKAVGLYHIARVLLWTVAFIFEAEAPPLVNWIVASVLIHFSYFQGYSDDGITEAQAWEGPDLITFICVCLWMAKEFLVGLSCMIALIDPNFVLEGIGSTELVTQRRGTLLLLTRMAACWNLCLPTAFLVVISQTTIAKTKLLGCALIPNVVAFAMSLLAVREHSIWVRFVHLLILNFSITIVGSVFLC